MLAPLAASIFFSFFAPAAAGVSHGLAWATDNRQAPKIGNMPCVNWYYHWADPVVPEMPGKVEFVPMYWGPKNRGKWEGVKQYMNSHQPRHLLAFNEPDLPGQADMDPYYAADEFMREIVPWGRRGVKIGSPAVAFKADWLKTFLSELNKKGGYVDFIAMHWYGKHTEIESFKAQVGRIHDAAPGYDIWVTEVGLGGDGGYFPNAQQAQDFASQAFGFMDSQSYIKRAAWFGSFESDNTPDAFGKGANAFFSGNSQLTGLAHWYGNSCSGSSPESPSKNPGNSGNSGNNGNNNNNNNEGKNETKKSTKTSSSAAATKTGKAKKCKRGHGPKSKAKRSRIGALLHKKKRNH